ncbi:Cysteine proteinase 2 [Papilio machaon]|uniref:Cysteine proteinase 2 n=1 Tax=Papilio machaon TaxID=76193 RepID=A0A194QYG6_PAPMA|nr:Cysteine proteinase 2 [Papilio machaon]
MLLKSLLFLFVGTALGYVDKQSPPQWSNVYTVKGLLVIPYAELHEPFYAWLDHKPGVAPVTTEKELNKETCLQVNGTEDQNVSIQSVLPDMTDFKFVGTETMQDADTSKWRMVQTIGDKVNKYTMWVKYKKSLRGDPLPIPVRYEMKGFNSLLGSHYDHYYLDYRDYNVEDIDPNVFDVDRNMKCTSFPGPGSRHFATFNPMKEFVHPVHNAHVDNEFDRFKTKHNKKYASEIEHVKRLNIFRQNLRYIHSNNRARRGFTLAVNHLADWAEDELAALRGRRYSGPSPLGLQFPYGVSELEEMSVKLPPEFDWRLFGAVTPVKDQSVCGSCWSFGTVGAVEGALFLHNGGHLVRLSQQTLIDCSWGYGNNGCDGGEDFRAYQWIMKHGLPTEEDYGDYLGQIDELDHAVLAVGYGVLNGQKYWLVKNSWSNLWGNDGYVLMSSRDNNCGKQNLYPSIHSASLRPLLGIGHPQRSPRGSVLCNPHPGYSRNLDQIILREACPRCADLYVAAIPVLCGPIGRPFCGQYGRPIAT